jgi:hypothetical protein
MGIFARVKESRRRKRKRSTHNLMASKQHDIKTLREDPGLGYREDFFRKP